MGKQVEPRRVKPGEPLEDNNLANQIGPRRRIP